MFLYIEIGKNSMERNTIRKGTVRIETDDLHLFICDCFHVQYWNEPRRDTIIETKIFVLGRIKRAFLRCFKMKMLNIFYAETHISRVIVS